MPKPSKSGGNVPKYDLTNPVRDEFWLDAKKRYTWESYRAGWNRAMCLTKKNYGVWPIFVLSTVIVPISFTGFIYYRLTHVPDVWSPNSHPHWDDWEHRHAKLNTPSKEGLKELMSTHRRPRFEWQYKDKSMSSKVNPFVFRNKPSEPHLEKDKSHVLTPYAAPRGT